MFTTRETGWELSVLSLQFPCTSKIIPKLKSLFKGGKKKTSTPTHDEKSLQTRKRKEVPCFGTAAAHPPPHMPSPAWELWVVTEGTPSSTPTCRGRTGAELWSRNWRGGGWGGGRVKGSYPRDKRGGANKCPLHARVRELEGSALPSGTWEAQGKDSQRRGRKGQRAGWGWLRTEICEWTCLESNCIFFF